MSFKFPPYRSFEEKREFNITENRRKMIELGLIEEERPKCAAKRKKPVAAPKPSLAPTRQSTRKRNAVKYTEDDGAPLARRRRLSVVGGKGVKEGKEEREEEEEEESVTEKIHSCPSCGISFGDMKHLEVHLHPASGRPSFCKEKVLGRMEGRPYPCKICPKAYLYLHRLEKHMDSVHDNVAKFNCDQCDKPFKSCDSLKRHIKEDHELASIFSCDICDKKFNQKRYLEAHKKVHAEETPFMCNICEKAFKLKHQMTRHVDTAHLGKKPFQCKICSKEFSLSYNLARHITSLHLKFICPVSS